MDSHSGLALTLLLTGCLEAPRPVPYEYGTPSILPPRAICDRALPPLSGHVFSVDSPGEIADALAIAEPGDTVAIAPGDYGPLAVDRVHGGPGEPIAIFAAASGVRVGAVAVADSSAIVIDGLEIDGGLRIADSPDLTARCLKIHDGAVGILAERAPALRIEQNAIFDNDTALDLGDAESALVRNNLLHRNPVGIVVLSSADARLYHNTVVADEALRIDTPIAPRALRNNLFVGVANVAADSNLFFTDVADAGFADDYRLSAASPAVDAGIELSSVRVDLDGNPRPAGNAVDIGAYEYQ